MAGSKIVPSVKVLPSGSLEVPLLSVISSCKSVNWLEIIPPVGTVLVAVDDAMYRPP